MPNDQKSCTQPADPQGDQVDPCRLWIGNLDSRMTEYNLLKILQKFGTLQRYDFLYHKAGPDVGKSRGYCFATYSKPEEAKAAQQSLNGKKAYSKNIIVKQAHTEKKDEVLKFPTTSLSSPNSSPVSKSTQIAAIEAKLKHMEQEEDLTSFLPKTTASISSSSTSPSTQGLSRLAQAAMASGLKPSHKHRSGINNHRHSKKPYHQR